MTHRARRAIVVVTSLLAMAPCVANAETNVAVSAPAVGEDEALYRCKNSKAEVAVSFKPDMELKELMTWVVGFTCKNFILDPRVVVTGKKITVIAPNKMSAGEAYRLFLVALSTMNLTVVPKGNVLRIVDAGASRRDTVPIMKKGVPSDDQVVRYILRPTYAGPDALVQALTALKSEIGEVQQVGSMLMLTDYGGNVRDMLSLVKMVDVPKGSEGIYTIAIEHANAQVVKEKVGGILGMGTELAAAGAKPGPPGAPGATPASTLAPSKVMVDERTNTIILAASEVAYERFRALAKRIDVPLDIEGGQSVHVYRLSNAIAEELAKTINDTVGQTQNAAAATPPIPKPPADGPGSTVIDGKVKVIADKPTNSLIVLATGRDFLALKEVIAALDLPRPQVYIETMIVEVTVSDDTSTDGSVHGATALEKAMLLGGVHTTDVNSATALTPGSKSLAAPGLLAGLLGPSVSLLGLTIPSYGVLFNAISLSSRTNVLQTPSMMALDNETAKLKVGKSIPLERTLENPAGGRTTNVEFRPLNLELELKPHITSDNQIMLEVKHAAEDEGEKSSFGGTISNRAYETRVIVRDQQTIVIGGILQEKTQHTKEGVPILGHIPLLGRLFSYTEKRKRKSNTLILLTPYIVRNQFDLERIRLRKVQEHEEFAGSLKAFEGMKYQPKMDYARKRGLVEEINRSIQGVEEDRATFEKMSKPFAIPSGPIELPIESE